MEKAINNYTRQTNFLNVSKLFTVFILFFPLLSIYATPIPVISWGELLILFLIVIMLGTMIKYHIIFKYTPFYKYLIYALVSTLFISLLLLIIKPDFTLNDMIRRVLRDSFYFAVIVFFGPIFFNFEYGKALIRKISIVLCMYMFIQVIFFALFKVYIPGLIPSLKTTISGGLWGRDIINHFANNAILDGYARGVGFFSEPAVSAHFLTVALLLELFSGVKRKRWALLILYSAGMLVTVSVNAYIALFACWEIYILYSNRKNKINFLICILVSIFMLTISFAIMQLMSSNVLERIIELFSGNKVTGSSVIRVIRGTAFYLKMPIFYQLFGSGFGNFIQFKNAFDISTIYETADEYINTNAYILVSSGIIGFILFIWTLYRHIKHKVAFSKAMFFLMFIFGLSSSIYSSPQFVIMMVFLMNAPVKKVIKNGNKYHYAS